MTSEEFVYVTCSEFGIKSLYFFLRCSVADFKVMSGLNNGNVVLVACKVAIYEQSSIYLDIPTPLR